MADIEYEFKEVVKTGVEVYNYAKTNKTCPNLININGNNQNRAEFLRLIIYAILQAETGDKSNIKIDRMNVVNPEAPMNIRDGNLTKAEYISHIRPHLEGYMNVNRRNPELDTISLGSMNLNKAVIVYSYILYLYNLNGKLPDTVDITTTNYHTDGSGGSTVPDNLKQYLVATKNCQSTNSRIINIANTLSGAEAIFNYDRDEIGYDYYYNTKYGAVGVLDSGIANCCDDAHLIVALGRAKGIPARYVHCDEVVFSSITTGHVWAELYVNGAWKKADGSNNNNTFGNNPKDSQLKGTIRRYAELPF